MNPKEKAKELVETYHKLLIYFPYIDGENDKCGEGNMTFNSAKQCAIICVDEIMKANPIVPLEFMLESEALDAAREYWQQVKNEIELL